MQKIADLMFNNIMKEMLKFYADAPDKTKNKFLCYEVKDLNHSIGLLNRFVEKGWIIRTAYHHFSDDKQVKINKDLLDRYINTN